MIGTASLREGGRKEGASEAGRLADANGRGVGQTDKQTDPHTRSRQWTDYPPTGGRTERGERSIAIGNIMELTPQSPII